MDLLLAAKIVYLVFGVLTAVGGLMGFLKAKSVASLIAGGVSGLLLIVAALLIPASAKSGLIMGLLVSALLVGQFLPKLIRRQFKPHILISVIFGLIAIVVTILAWPHAA